MIWSSAAVTAGEVSAKGDDAPLIVAANLVRSAARKWTATGLDTDADITLATAPTDWACDGDLRFGTTRTAGTATNHYFNLVWSTSVTWDTVFLKVLGGTSINSVTIEISDNGTSGWATIATWSAALNPNGRMVALTLNSGNNRYSGTGYMRVRFNYGSASTAPLLAELVVGRRRQLSRRPDQSSGYDDLPYGSAYIDQRFRGRDRQRYIEASGFTDWVGAFSPHGSDQYGLDDITTLRTIAAESRGLRDPVLWIDRPNTFADVVTNGFLEFDQDGLRLPFVSWALRAVTFKHEELPPFMRNDARYIGV